MHNSLSLTQLSSAVPELNLQEWTWWIPILSQVMVLLSLLACLATPIASGNLFGISNNQTVPTGIFTCSSSGPPALIFSCFSGGPPASTTSVFAWFSGEYNTKTSVVWEISIHRMRYFQQWDDGVRQQGRNEHFSGFQSSGLDGAGGRITKQRCILSGILRTRTCWTTFSSLYNSYSFHFPF